MVCSAARHRQEPSTGMTIDRRATAATQLALPLARRRNGSPCPPSGSSPSGRTSSGCGATRFHPMCSYLASFPAALAHAFIARYSRPGDVVLDPFSGRGTTPLQACAEGRIGVGNDLNPFAHLLTAAKVEPATRPGPRPGCPASGSAGTPARPAGRRSPSGWCAIRRPCDRPRDGHRRERRGRRDGPARGRAGIPPGTLGQLLSSSSSASPTGRTGSWPRR